MPTNSVPPTPTSDMDLGSWIYSSKNHDEHHGRGHGNYAQFLKIIDVFGGTRVEWSGDEGKNR